MSPSLPRTVIWVAGIDARWLLRLHDTSLSLLAPRHDSTASIKYVPLPGLRVMVLSRPLRRGRKGAKLLSVELSMQKSSGKA